MRKSAITLTAAIFTVSIPAAALAENMTIDGITYYQESTTAPVYDAYTAPAIGDYSETLYFPGSDTEQAVEEMPMVIEYMESEAVEPESYTMIEETPTYAGYEQPETAGQSIMTEVIDGIVYETVMEGDIQLSEDVMTVTTY